MTMVIVVALAALMALGNWSAGWWAVIVIAAIAGATWRQPRAAALSALAAGASSCMLLVLDAAGGRLGTLAAMLGGVFPIPGAALLLLTVLLAAALGWSGAVLGTLCRETVSALRTTRHAR